ncbi:MAG: TIGR01777 family protein [Bacteroidetes bacterium]|nr:MAG: TIGR01777 family protein [Bacteroidota bacterium]
MKIGISGHTGFIGTSLKEYFTAQGHEIIGIGREDFKKGTGHLAALISGTDILINLAGAPIIKRWTKSYSKKLWDSRIVTTRLLADALAETRDRPKAFFSSSAVGIYGNEGIHTEKENKYNEDFLGILCQRWEEEALRARIHCPVYIIRTGIILGKDGGALPQMALPFKLYVGGKLGNGRQMTSWMHIQDYVKAVEYLIEKLPKINIFNFTAPAPVSNAEFSSVLAQTLNRPNLFMVPGFALRLLFGEGSVALLEGQHVLPKNLQDEGFTFQFPELKSALQDLLQE